MQWYQRWDVNKQLCMYVCVPYMVMSNSTPSSNRSWPIWGAPTGTCIVSSIWQSSADIATTSTSSICVIYNVNITYLCYLQRRHHVYVLSTTSTSCICVIYNVNIMYLCYLQRQHHVSVLSTRHNCGWTDDFSNLNICNTSISDVICTTSSMLVSQFCLLVFRRVCKHTEPMLTANTKIDVNSIIHRSYFTIDMSTLYTRIHRN
jgi:hypothetical protein